MKQTSTLTKQMERDQVVSTYLKEQNYRMMENMLRYHLGYENYTLSKMMQTVRAFAKHDGGL